MKIKEFKEKVAEVLKREPMIGCTEEEEIRWKMKEIMRLGVGKGIEEIEKFCRNLIVTKLSRKAWTSHEV